MKINLMFVYKEYKQDIYEAIENFLSDFPMLNNRDIYIHMCFLDRRLKRSFASCRNNYGMFKIRQEIKLNPAAFLFPDIKFKLMSVMTANYKTVKDIIWHELGHTLQIYFMLEYCNLNMKYYVLLQPWFRYKLGNWDTIQKCFKEHMERHMSQSDWDYQKTKRLLGTYCCENPEEFIPECFNNFYRLKNKNNLSNVEQQIYTFTKSVIEDCKKHLLKTTK